jgi:phosphate starvation-inducible PhoH-like protein
LTQAVSRRITLDDHQECLQLFGEKDLTLKLLRDSFAVTLVARGNEILLSGEPVEVSHATQVIERLRGHLKKGQEGYLSGAKVSQLIAEAKGQDGQEEPDPVQRETILVSSRKKPIAARTENQQRYVDSIRNHDIVVGIGPAGTGKT